MLQGKESWGKKVYGRFLYFFQDQDRSARMSAEAALCLHSQKSEYFWSFVKASQGSDNPNDEAIINASAKQSGADFASFRECFLSRKFKQEVDNQLALVKSLGVTQSPLLVVDGKVYEKPENLDPIVAAFGGKRAFSGLTKAIGSKSIKSQKQGFFSRIWSFITGIFN